MSTRVGLGVDAHPWAADRTLKLGGIEIPDAPGLQGHSDGDALLHAITDAILGAAGLPSIGELFSDRDPAWRGADSSRFVETARRLALEKGFRTLNVDAVVLTETPRVAPHAAAIRARIGQLLELSPDAVNVRGTSTNGLGFVGRKDGLAAVAVVLLETVGEPE